MSNRHSPKGRSAGRTSATRHGVFSTVMVEGLEGRQLLSASSLHHARHLAHEAHVARAAHRAASAVTATHDYVLRHASGTTARPMTSTSPYGYTPSQVRHAYGMDAVSFNGVTGDGSGQTIAIVDAYNDPNITADLHTFDAQFGLNDPTFTVEGQTGSTSSLPGVDPAGKGNSWAVETSLDVEWAHAVAPKANILLVEANSASFSDLFAAIDTARRASGVSVVSMSFGGGEFSGQSYYDQYLTTPAGHQGVTFVASSGDDGAYGTGGSTMTVEYPAASANVVAVGGTRLALDSSGNYASETAWGNGTSSGTSGGAGGGISQYTSQPSYQRGTVTQTSTQRGVPDVAFLADPNSGVAVVDSYDFSTAPWLQVGGTSLAAPMWGGVMSMVNQDRAAAGLGTLDGPTGTLPGLYALSGSDFHDVTTGNNGYAAGTGYDLVTGRGTPIVSQLVNDLSGVGSSGGTGTGTGTGTGGTTAGKPTISSFALSPASVTAGGSTTAVASNVAETGGAGSIASVKFYQETNGVAGYQAGFDTLIGTGTQTAAGTYSMSIGTTGVTPGAYTIYAVATDAAGVNSAASSATLTVNSAGPADDMFANAYTLTGTSGTITATNVNATKETGEPSHAGNRGGKSIWFNWTAPTSKRVVLTTRGSNFDTLLAIYTGNAVNALRAVASNDDYGGYTYSTVVFNAVAGQTYRIAVDGYNAASGNVSLTMS